MRFPFIATTQLIQIHATGADWQRLFHARTYSAPWLYHSYLRSTAWQAKKTARLELDNHHCTRCPLAGPLDVHHTTYERIGNENVEIDLVTLCRACHRDAHGIDRMAVNARPGGRRIGGRVLNAKAIMAND